MFDFKQIQSLYWGHGYLCMEYGSHMWGDSTFTTTLDRLESKAFRLILHMPTFHTTMTSLLKSQWHVSESDLDHNKVIKVCKDLMRCLPGEAMSVFPPHLEKRERCGRRKMENQRCSSAMLLLEVLGKRWLNSRFCSLPATGINRSIFKVKGFKPDTTATYFEASIT